MTDLNSFDKSKFSNLPFVKKVDKPWGYELHWVPENKEYMGKILHINKDARLSLQVHDQKEESWFLMSGRAKLIWDDEKGNLMETELEQGVGYSCHVGQRHRFVGITDCDVIEVSTSEKGTTYRLDDDYNRPDETEDMRKDPNRGWK